MLVWYLESRHHCAGSWFQTKQVQLRRNNLQCPITYRLSPGHYGSNDTSSKFVSLKLVEEAVWRTEIPVAGKIISTRMTCVKRWSNWSQHLIE